MNIYNTVPHGIHQSQQFHREYGANALLPEIAWTEIFENSPLQDEHQQALNAIYQSAVPLALQVFDELKFDVFAPASYQPQGLGLFDRLAAQEETLLQRLESESSALAASVRQHIWSMLLRGGAVLVFKAWLGKVKSGRNTLDVSQFDELSDLLFIKTSPVQLAQRLKTDIHADQEHIFLLHDNDIYLDRFNSLETAALFVDLGVCDAAFLSLRDDRVAHYLKGKGYVTDEQIDELQCALNPLFCTDASPKQSCIA